MKPTILAPQLWGKHIALEVEVDRVDDRLLRDIHAVRRVISSQAACAVFIMIAKGLHSPGGIARQINKSKFAVSLQISELKTAQLIKQISHPTSDLRQKYYELSLEKMVDIFRQDHALEVELYENYLLAKPLKEIRGTIKNAELVILGSGKLGLLREVVPEKSVESQQEQNKVTDKMDRLFREFEQLFRAFLRERQFRTIREYYLAFYRELSTSYRRLPRVSELAHFYEFVDRSLAKIMPIEELWRKNVIISAKEPQHFKYPKRGFNSLKLFLEAGRTDHAGRYILNAETRSIIKPGVRVKIYPSYSFMN